MYLNWKEAAKLISSNLKQELLLNPLSKYGRKVVLVPPYKCRTNIFKGLEGYNIQIGKNKFIDVPTQMLEGLYSEALKNNGEYNRTIFLKLYPKLYLNTPCYIHVVGKIFTISDLAIRSGYSKYWIKSYLDN